MYLGEFFFFSKKKIFRNFSKLKIFLHILLRPRVPLFVRTRTCTRKAAYVRPYRKVRLVRHCTYVRVRHPYKNRVDFPYGSRARTGGAQKLCGHGRTAPYGSRTGAGVPYGQGVETLCENFSTLYFVFFYLFFICFLERKSTRKKREKIFFFLLFYYLRLEKIKVFNF